MRSVPPNPFDSGYYETSELRGFGFASVGENVRIHRTCNIIGLDRISIGSNVRIDAHASIIANSGYAEIGSYIHICIGCMIGARGGFVMEDFAGLSHGSRVLTASDDFGGEFLTNSLVPAEYTSVKAEPVRIGRHVAIGASVTILPGVDLGNGSAIGSGSLVTRNVPEWEIHCGVPAKKRGERTRGVLEHERAILLAEVEPPAIRIAS